MKAFSNPYRKLKSFKTKSGALVLGLEKKKKKRRYSKGLRDLQKYGQALTRYQTRMAAAKLEEMNVLAKASDKSSRRKKDGALRDSMKNYGKAMRANKKLSTKASKRFFKEVSRLRMSKQFGPTIGI